MSRTGLLDLVAPTARNEHKPPVKAIYQRTNSYAQRGVWLIPAENLFRYLLGLIDSAAEEHNEAVDLRNQNSVESRRDQEASLFSRNTRKKGKKFPTPGRTALVPTSTKEVRS